MASSESKRYFFIAIPFLIIGGFFFLLYSGLTLNPYGNSIKIINKPLLSIKSTNLFQWNNLIDTGNFQKQNEGRWYLINVWASWCDICLNEHPFLMDLARQGVTIYGVDNNDAAPAAKKWLSTYGNPYTQVIWDARSIVSTSLGVTSVPSTFLIDPQGIVRYRVTGPLTPAIWKETLVPVIEKNEVIVLPKKK